MEIGTLKSLNPKLTDIPLTPSELTLGRNPKSSIILSDIRCSGFHCSITPQNPPNWEFLIKDLSSNGTYINGTLVIPNQIGRGNSKIANFSDSLEILPLGKGVESGSELVFLFLETNKRKNLESAPEKAAKITENTVEDQATCTICCEIMMDPVSLYPCLHSFCENCYLDWKNRSPDCPYCRESVKEVQKSKFMQEIVGIIAGKHPEKMKVVEKCEQCEKKGKKFQCGPGQRHVKCCKCQVLMPKREGQRQTCEMCKENFCNLYFGHCASGLTQLKLHFSKEFAMPLGCLGNLYEENILSDYIRINKLTGSQIIEIINKESYLRFGQDSTFCEKCALSVQTEVLDKFLEIVHENIPKITKNNKRCPKGRQCIMQNSVIHSQIYSHY